MGVGRVICVALPFILTACSIICMLAAGLAGITSTGLYMFRVNTTDFQISPSELGEALESRSTVHWNDVRLASAAGTTSKPRASDVSSALSTNITASDIPILDGYYDIALWGYCFYSESSGKSCSKAKFDWADTYLNTSTLSTDAGVNVTIPDSITDALKVFKSVTKWTEVVYIIAMIALALEILFGFFTACSRGVSCLTWLIAGLAGLAVGAAAAMMTAMSVIVVGTVEATAKWYGVTSSFDTSFLAVIWLGVAFALGAGLFWMFTICCCKPEHRARRTNKRHLDEQEKFLPTGGYAPLNDSNKIHGYNQQQYGVPRHEAHSARSDLAYEPYSHSNV